jgi:CheY-like chemotaxis protein
MENISPNLAEIPLEIPSRKFMEILLVEDQAGEVHFLPNAFSPLPIRLHIVESSEAALAFLRRQGLYAQAPRPDYILLDQDRRKQNGRTVLTTIKRDPRLGFQPVIVSLTAEAEWVFLRAQELSADHSLLTPPDLRQILGILLKQRRQSP